MAGEVWIALIGVGGTAGAPVLSYWMQGKRAKRDAIEKERTETQELLEAAASAFLEARATLDTALLTPGDHKLDSLKLFLPLARHADLIGFRLGPEDPIAAAYREARDRWVDAVNLAMMGPQQHEQKILTARNAAEEAKERFLELAASRLDPKNRRALASAEG